MLNEREFISSVRKRFTKFEPRIKVLTTSRYGIIFSDNDFDVDDGSYDQMYRVKPLEEVFELMTEDEKEFYIWNRDLFCQQFQGTYVYSSSFN